MTLILCLDQKNGVSFNNRRQSRDSAVIARICKMAENSKLGIKEYSKSLFSLPCSYINVCETPLENAKNNDLCFLESDVLNINYENVDKIVVFRWDKVYPQDECLNINLNVWKKFSANKFIGSSHEEIIEEVYVK